MGTTFLLVVIGWILFRSASIRVAVDYIGRLFDWSMFTMPIGGLKKMIPLILILITVEWVQRHKKHGLELSGINSQIVKYALYYIILGLMIWFSGKSETFIYFQF